MRIGSADENKVIVTVKRAFRDNDEYVEGKDGKKVKNKQYGKIVYESHESIDVYDATPEEVTAAVTKGLNAATTKK